MHSARLHTSRVRAIPSPAQRSMSVTQDLIHLLELEPLEHNIYRGLNRDVGTGRVFGGQVFAQALVAARKTVGEGREAHSVHGYFLREGDTSAPIVYFVDRPRDGRSFTSRRVTAIQHGEAIFHLSASFHLAEPGLDHQTAMPDVPAPEDCPEELALIRANADRIPEPLRAILTQERPLELRLITPSDPFRPPTAVPPAEAKRQVWFRMRERIPDDQMLHHAILAYASDYGFLPTALRPHGVSWRDPRLIIASLDHTLWLHRPFRADEWLLYVSDAPSAFGARGFVRGQVFTRDGQLVASAAQEGLLRMRDAR
jgi:acyl-CoA thioesterase-2